MDLRRVWQYFPAGRLLMASMLVNGPGYFRIC